MQGRRCRDVAVALRIGIVDSVGLECADGIVKAALEGVKCIYEQNQALAPVRLDVRIESLELACYRNSERSDVAVGHRSA